MRVEIIDPGCWWLATREDFPFLKDPEAEDGRVRDYGSAPDWRRVAAAAQSIGRALARGEFKTDDDGSASLEIPDLGPAEAEVITAWFYVEPVVTDVGAERILNGQHRLWKSFAASPDLTVLPVCSEVLTDNVTPEAQPARSRHAGATLAALDHKQRERNPHYAKRLQELAGRFPPAEPLAPITDIWEATSQPSPWEAPRATSAGPQPSHIKELEALIAARPDIELVGLHADGWSSGMAHAVLGSLPSQYHLAIAFGHRLPVDVEMRMLDFVAERRPVPSRPWSGPWWPSEDGWAVGWISGPNGPAPAIAWPAAQTRQVIRRLKRQAQPRTGFIDRLKDLLRA